MRSGLGRRVIHPRSVCRAQTPGGVGSGLGGLLESVWRAPGLGGEIRSAVASGCQSEVGSVKIVDQQGNYLTAASCLTNSSCAVWDRGLSIWSGLGKRFALLLNSFDRLLSTSSLRAQ